MSFAQRFLFALLAALLMTLLSFALANCFVAWSTHKPPQVSAVTWTGTNTTSPLPSPPAALDTPSRGPFTPESR